MRNNYDDNNNNNFRTNSNNKDCWDTIRWNNNYQKFNRWNNIRSSYSSKNQWSINKSVSFSFLVFQTEFHDYVAKQPSHTFNPCPCPNSALIGAKCDVSNDPCSMRSPCRNNGICYNTAIGNYSCLCLSGFNGTHCEFDYRPCKLNTCFNDGIYILLKNAKIILFL